MSETWLVSPLLVRGQLQFRELFLNLVFSVPESTVDVIVATEVQNSYRVPHNRGLAKWTEYVEVIFRWLWASENDTEPWCPGHLAHGGCTDRLQIIHRDFASRIGPVLTVPVH